MSVSEARANTSVIVVASSGSWDGEDGWKGMVNMRETMALEFSTLDIYVPVSVYMYVCIIHLDKTNSYFTSIS